jgi:hypothetical protein
MDLKVVEVAQEFQVHGYVVRPGARVMAWSRSEDAWVVYFNGNEVDVEPGTVFALGTAPVEAKAAEVYSAARLEQYQLAPADPG